MHDELLNDEIFYSLAESKVVIEVGGTITIPSALTVASAIAHRHWKRQRRHAPPPLPPRFTSTRPRQRRDHILAFNPLHPVGPLNRRPLPVFGLRQHATDDLLSRRGGPRRSADRRHSASAPATGFYHCWHQKCCDFLRYAAHLIVRSHDLSYRRELRLSPTNHGRERRYLAERGAEPDEPRLCGCPLECKWKMNWQRLCSEVRSCVRPLSGHFTPLACMEICGSRPYRVCALEALGAVQVDAIPFLRLLALTFSLPFLHSFGFR
jgi:hypothetical protein